MALAFALFGNKLLLFCYHSFTILACSGQILLHCYLMQCRFFSFEKYSAILLFYYSATAVAKLSSVYKYSSILLLCYLRSRIFLIWAMFCYSAISVSQIFLLLWNILLLCSHLNSRRVFHLSASAIIVNQQSSKYDEPFRKLAETKFQHQLLLSPQNMIIVGRVTTGVGI